MDSKRFFLIGLVASMIFGTSANAVFNAVEVFSSVASNMKNHPYASISAAGLLTATGATLMYQWRKGHWPFHARQVQAANQGEAPAAQPQTLRQKMVQKVSHLFRGVRPAAAKVAAGANAAWTNGLKPAANLAQPYAQAVGEKTISAVKTVLRYFRRAPQAAQAQPQAVVPAANAQPAEAQNQQPAVVVPAPAAPVAPAAPAVVAGQEVDVNASHHGEQKPSEVAAK